MSRGTFSVWSASVTVTNALSSPETDTGARNARSWNSITSCPTRLEDWPRSRTSRFAVGATTNTRPSWSSALLARRSSVRGAPVP